MFSHDTYNFQSTVFQYCLILNNNNFEMLKYETIALESQTIFVSRSTVF
jgi:hypothetical protein